MISLQECFSQRRWGRFAASLLLPIVLTLAACGGNPTATPLATATPPVATIAAQVENTPTVAPTATPTATPTLPVAPAVATPGTPGASVVPTPTATPIPPTATPTPVPPTATPIVVGKPVRLKIPTIKVDAAIEYVGLAPDGAMDTPKNYSNTAWYQLGPRPGDLGNSAIAGHVDSKTGKAVFWDLPKLKAGDEVFVAGDDGVERKFIVTGIESYKREDAPLDRIFGPSTARHLNLITCDVDSGFNRTTSSYGGNVVVYTELAPGQ
ncbi:MAG: class F sortase [Thermomicrobiales bacterium]